MRGDASRGEASSPQLVPAVSSRHYRLSPQEHRVLQLVGDGCSNKQIARQLGITDETVKSHVKHIFEKLDVDRRSQAVQRAFSEGLLQPHH
ncbi:response regulator transcription factor [Tardiphaga alba]|uniref:response regulator transcription factor n=1 Tax=Tardiphaga alba TaxID=340268 RepID=UPI0038B67867